MSIANANTADYQKAGLNPYSNGIYSLRACYDANDVPMFVPS